MAKIFSWKIDDNLYGYLAPIDGNNSYTTSLRIESQDILTNIVSKVSGYTVSQAKNAFNIMAQELKLKYGKSIQWKPEYWSGSSVNGNTIILSGKDGTNGRKANESVDGTEIKEGFYEELEKYIDKCVNEAETRIKQSNEEVKKYLSEATSKDVQDAISALTLAKEELSKIESEAIKSISAATSALDGARALFSGGSITPESIKNVIDKTDVVSKWMSGNSESLSAMTFDYDEANKILAGGYTATTVGAFSEMAVGMNVISSTVGSVRQDMNAVEGRITDMGTHVNTIENTVSEVKRDMAAMDSRIKDAVTYEDLKAEVSTEVSREMSGAEGRIIDKVISKSSTGITVLSKELNGLSGFVETKIVGEMSGSITTMKDKMDVMDGEISKAMTKADSALSSATTLRDEWNVSSGMIRSVSDMVASADSEGVFYLYMEGTEQKPESDKRVWRNPSDGLYYTDKTFTTKVDDQTRVYTVYSTQLASYIKQTSSSVTISVMSDAETMGAAIHLVIDENKHGTMDLIANKITLAGDTIIGGGLSAKTADIGGIFIGKGKIQSTKKIDGKPSFELDGNTGGVTAQSANIKGKIVAEEGSIGGIEIKSDSITSSNNLFSVNSEGELIAQNAKINGGITASTGDKISIMDAETFKVSKGDNYVSIEVLEEWSGKTNVPVLCMYYGGIKYVMSPGAWEQQGGGDNTYGRCEKDTYVSSYDYITNSSITDIKNSIQQYTTITKRTQLEDLVSLINNNLKNILTKDIGIISKTTTNYGAEVPDKMKPLMDKYFNGYFNIPFMKKSNVNTDFTTLNGNLFTSDKDMRLLKSDVGTNSLYVNEYVDLEWICNKRDITNCEYRLYELSTYKDGLQKDFYYYAYIIGTYESPRGGNADCYGVYFGNSQPIIREDINIYSDLS